MFFLSIHLFADGKDRTVVDEEAYHPVEVNRLFHLNGTRGIVKTKRPTQAKQNTYQITASMMSASRACVDWALSLEFCEFASW